MITVQISAALTGECLAELNVDGAATIAALKDMIEERTGVPIVEQVLLKTGETHALSGKHRLHEIHAGCKGCLAMLLVRQQRPMVLTVCGPGDDSTLKLGEIENDSWLGTLEGHTCRISALDVDWDQMLALSCSVDGTLKLWNLRTYECIRNLQGHTGGATDLSAHWYGMRAVSFSRESVRMWDLNDGRCIRTWFEDTDLRLRSLAVNWMDMSALVGSVGSVLQLRDLENDQILTTYNGGHTRQITTISVDWASRQAVSGSDDHTLKLWSLESSWCCWTYYGHTGWIKAICVDWGTMRALSSSDDCTMKLWDLGTGGCLWTYVIRRTIRALSVDWGHMRALTGLRDSMKLWDLESGVCLWERNDAEPMVTSRCQAVSW